MNPDDHLLHVVPWLDVAMHIQRMAASLPFGDEPRRVHWDHPDEQWKDEQEAEAVEAQYSSEAIGCIEEFFARRKWPRARTHVRWCIHRHLERAARIAESWSSMPTPLAVAIRAERSPSIEAVAQWLLTGIGTPGAGSGSGSPGARQPQP